MVACGLSDGQMAGFDLRDQLTFEFGFELSTNLSHYEYPAPHPRAETIGGREGLWKMPQLWKSTTVACGGFSVAVPGMMDPIDASCAVVDARHQDAIVYRSDSHGPRRQMGVPG